MTRAGAALEPVLHPRSVAVVGASANPDSPGNDYVRCLIDFGFGGPIYPINPRLEELLGLKAYPSLRDVPGPVDYVISCIPAEAVLALVDDCRARKVRTLHLFTGRFSETGREEGARLEQELLARARAAGVRIIGPNCMGLYDPALGLSFRPDLPQEPGAVALISQSGNLAVELVCRSAARGVRFSRVISYGNALDLDEADFLEYLAQDDRTQVIGAYLEGVKDGRRFLAALHSAAARKPVVVLKAGSTGAGARSARSHTAALAGAQQVWRAALRQAAAVEVATGEELMDMLVAFSRWPSVELGPKRRSAAMGRRVGVVGGGGGRSVQSADACEEASLAVVPLPDEIRSALRERAPLLADWVGNPVDQSILAGSGIGSVQLLEMMVESPHFDLLAASLGEDWLLGRPDARDRLRHVVERFLEVGQRCRKPLAFVVGPPEWPEEWRRHAVDEARQRLVEAGMAVFPTIERAARALGRFVWYWEERLAGEG